MRKITRSHFFSMTDSYLNTYLPYNCGCSSATSISYRNALKTFINYLYRVRKLNIRKFKFSDCTFDLVLEYRNWLIDEMHFKPATVNHKIVVLKAYIHYAALQDIAIAQYDVAVSQIPLLTVPKNIKPIIDAEESLKALLSSPKDTRLGRRDRLIMSLLLDTAIRVSELCNMKLKDVCYKMNPPYVRVDGKGRKERIIAISDKTVTLIKGYINEYHPTIELEAPFFYTVIHGKQDQMSVRNIQRILHKYGIKTKDDGFDIPDSVSPHMMRRTRGTTLLQSGVNVYDVADMLGHSSPQTTLNHYAQKSLEQKREAMKPGTDSIPDEKQDWPDDFETFKKICGLG